MNKHNLSLENIKNWGMTKSKIGDLIYINYFVGEKVVVTIRDDEKCKAEQMYSELKSRILSHEEWWEIVSDGSYVVVDIL